jgi:hypothetical protein
VFLKTQFMPSRSIIKEWTVIRKVELEENWKNIADKTAINKIEPLH